MDISNRTLSIFLLAAIVVSLGSTILTIDRYNALTGYAGSASGNVTLTVGSTLSITTSDNPLINFGACSPLSGAAGIINSENLSTTNTSQICPGYATDNISVRNDGNVYANVTIRSNKMGSVHGGTFLSSASNTSAFGYKTVKVGFGSYTNGCVGNNQVAYVNFSSTTANYTACSNLTYGPTNNSFISHFQIIVPYDAPQGQSDVILTYVAFNA